MKVKCKTACNGIGYRNLKVGEEYTIKKDVAEMLISFGYAESIKVKNGVKPKGG